MKLAVSACLLGEKVRFDGEDKLNRFITDELGKFAYLTPFCPEHLAFSTPRPSIRLVKTDVAIRVHTNKGSIDVTESLTQYSLHELTRLEKENLCGIIFKSKSPSCALKSATLSLENGDDEEKHDGVFAHICRNRYPLLPMEEEGRLEDAWLRENFLMQIFAYERFEIFKKTVPSLNDLIRFHTIHKFMLQTKHERLYRELDNLLINRENLPFALLFQKYELGFKTAIMYKSSVKCNRNVLENMSVFLKNDLAPIEKKTLHDQICDYAKNITPLIFPLSTIHLYAKKYDIRHLLEQTILDPYPKALALEAPKPHTLSGTAVH